MHRLLFVLVIVVAALFAFCFFPLGQEHMPTRPWIRQIAQGPFGWPIFFVFAAIVIGAFIALVSPDRRT